MFHIYEPKMMKISRISQIDSHVSVFVPLAALFLQRY